MQYAPIRILLTNTAALGLVTYPFQGVAMSIRAAAKSATRQRIVRARWKEAEYLVRTTRGPRADCWASVDAKFKELVGSARI